MTEGTKSVRILKKEACYLGMDSHIRFLGRILTTLKYIPEIYSFLNFHRPSYLTMKLAYKQAKEFQ